MNFNKSNNLNLSELFKKLRILAFRMEAISSQIFLGDLANSLTVAKGTKPTGMPK